MKILILTNNVKNIDNIKAGLKLAQDRAKTVGYNFEYTFKQTDKIFTGETFNNPAVGVGAAVNPQQILAEVDGAIGYKVACLIFDWNNVLPKPTNPVHHGTTKNGCTPIQIPEQWCGTPLQPEVLCQYFLHEICHAGFFFAGQNDTTHAYLPEFSQKQRYEYYLFLLKDLKQFLEIVIKPIKPSNLVSNIPTATITRDNDNGIQITGTLVANNNGATFTCKTIERPWKNNIMNISAIPKGTYQVRYSFSPRFMKYTYEIRNVVARSGIRIHSVNYAKDLLGCIGLGNKLVDINGDKQLDIINSRTTIKMFQDFMGKKSFTLEIK